MNIEHWVNMQIDSVFFMLRSKLNQSFRAEGKKEYLKQSLRQLMLDILLSLILMFVLHFGTKFIK